MMYAIGERIHGGEDKYGRIAAGPVQTWFTDYPSLVVPLYVVNWEDGSFTFERFVNNHAKVYQ